MTTVIRRSALVAFSAHQMFELVNQVGEYPRFLPWCRSTQILHQTAETVEASIEIAWSGIHKTFTTRNTLRPNESVQIDLVSGPFRHLTGSWQFVALGEKGCRITLDLEFELTGSMVDKLFYPVFHSVANSLVDAFCKRAVEIYGNE